MESRFNIPAPALVKLESDVDAENSWRLKVPVPARKGGGRGGYGRSGLFKADTKKSFRVFPELPVP